MDLKQNLVAAGDVQAVAVYDTQILQKLLHEQLQDHPQVETFKFADFDAGGTGATLVTLK
ncbi:MAG: Smr/MutS family protein [Candidatus Marinimicrobia bacterium]|nr:Smr/MutS family protein [Candidatus Neomarinimicrobiota bacterium]